MPDARHVADRYLSEFHAAVLALLSPNPSTAQDLLDEEVGFRITKRVEHRGEWWVVVSEKGKVLGRYRTKAEAVRRLRQIEGHKVGKRRDRVTEERLVNLLSELVLEGAALGGYADLVDQDRARLVASRLMATMLRQMSTQTVGQTVAGQRTTEGAVYRLETTFGLTARQASALDNYRQALLNPDVTSESVQRRFRLSSRTGLDLDLRQVDDAVGRYRDRLLNHRAFTIARTETMKAANVGFLEGARQAVQEGLLPASTSKVWVVTTDDRLCEECAPMEGMRVGLLDDFRSLRDPADTYLTPPLHVSCRCTLYVSAS